METLFVTETSRKVHFISLGCPRNLVDTEVMLGILLQAGYELTQDLEDADYLVVNTCGFLEESRNESLETIGLLLKERKAGAKVVVAGCMVQKHSAVIKERFPQVDYLLGSGEVAGILELIEAKEGGERITTARSYLESGLVPRTISTPKHYAYLKIAEGCRKRCAFCIIPNIKGPLKSKTVEQVLSEFKALLRQGVQEVILIAQDLGDFGKERKEAGALASLLRQMLKVEGDYWIRLLYLYPDEITDELIEVIKSDTRICRYLDMPIQHVSDPILQAMRRKTSKQDIIATYAKLRTELPECVIRTSLMVGFPGETEEHFEELVRFIKEHPLDNVGVFQFSPEAGAAAAGFDGQLDAKTKQRRYEKLMREQQKIVKKRNRAWIGRKLPVMLDGPHPESPLLLTGRHYGQCPEIDGMVIINDARKATGLGKLHLCEITDATDYDLIGRVIGPMPVKKQPKKRAGLKVFTG